MGETGIRYSPRQSSTVLDRSLAVRLAAFPEEAALSDLAGAVTASWPVSQATPRDR